MQSITSYSKSAHNIDTHTVHPTTREKSAHNIDTHFTVSTFSVVTSCVSTVTTFWGSTTTGFYLEIWNENLITNKLARIQRV